MPTVRTAVGRTAFRASLALLVLAFASSLLGQAEAQFDLPATPRGATHEIERCTLGLVATIDLPATEAGVLTYVGVKRGSQITAEQVLAKIDSREAELAYLRSQRELKLARERASDQIEITFAQATVLVERADWEEVTAANRDVPGAVTQAEVRKERLEYQRSVLGEEKAIKDHGYIKIEAQVKAAEVQLAAVAVDKREIRAPIDGEVLKLHREQGEGVQPGEVIAELANLETLQVDGKVYFDEHLPSDIADCRVTIEVPVGRDRVVEATGWVTYVDPIAEYVSDTRSRYRVRAEIANRKERGRWLLSPNMIAKMKIHLGTADEAQVGDRSPQTRVAK